MRIGMLLVFVVAVPLVGCSQGYTTSDPGVAVGAAAVTVAATGLNRAATGDCWARCSVGWACNRATGLCEQFECSPACSGGERCEVMSGGGLRCVPQGLVLGQGPQQSSTATTANSTPVGSRPGTGAPTPAAASPTTQPDPPLPSSSGGL